VLLFLGLLERHPHLRRGLEVIGVVHADDVLVKGGVHCLGNGCLLLRLLDDFPVRTPALFRLLVICIVLIVVRDDSILIIVIIVYWYVVLQVVLVELGAVVGCSRNLGCYRHLLLLVELLSVVNVNVKIHIDIVKVIVWNLRAARWRLRIARDFLFDGFVLLLPV